MHPSLPVLLVSRIIEFLEMSDIMEYNGGAVVAMKGKNCCAIAWYVDDSRSKGEGKFNSDFLFPLSLSTIAFPALNLSDSLCL